MPTPAPLPQATVGSVVTYLYSGLEPAESAEWPPDVFAIAAYILQKSGAYTQVVGDWPPGGTDNAGKWVGDIRKLGEDWREKSVGTIAVPAQIQSWWTMILSRLATPLKEVAKDRELCETLLQLLAAADEACAGVGIPDMDRVMDAFDDETLKVLLQNNSLCRRVSADLLRVLPKMHTPQNGITIRSLTHHLALCAVGEVNPQWLYQVPTPLPERPHGLNLLLVPWPKNITPLYFAPDKRGITGLRNMPESHGFFAFGETARPDWPTSDFRAMLRQAIRQLGRVDGVILPELSLRSENEFDEVANSVHDIDKNIFVVAGIGGKAQGEGGSYFGNNSVGYRRRAIIPELTVNKFQHKHHRWRLDESQIRQYGLCHRLNPYKSWWENTELKERELLFFSHGPWLTFSLLICEDLARQDPVADLLRTVGPNLIIALLMDGPQMLGRWSGRYATVFADDPGSSVLTLTSIGMSQLSQPANPNPTQPSRGRVIGLWKDARGFIKEIELPEGAQGMVLTLDHVYRKEWTADGRDDGEATSYLTFGGIHPIRLDAAVDT